METPKSYNRDIKVFKLETNEQGINFVVEKRYGQIRRITVIAGEDMIELKLNEFTSATERLKVKVIKGLVEIFKKIDHFMRGESPEEEQQQKECENYKNELIGLLVEYTNQDRNVLEIFLKEFTLEEVRRFYQYLRNIVLPKKYQSFNPAVVKDKQSGLNEEYHLEDEPVEQLTLFEIRAIGGYVKVMVNLQLLEHLTDDKLKKEIDQLLSDLESSFFEGEEKKVVLCLSKNKNKLDLLRRVIGLLTERGVRIRFTLCT